jgi:hypothetical protein
MFMMNHTNPAHKPTIAPKDASIVATRPPIKELFTVETPKLRLSIALQRFDDVNTGSVIKL